MKTKQRAGPQTAPRPRPVPAVTPGQLRTFAAVAELGSVRAAADRLRVTESAVSASLAALQRQLGVALLERVGRGVRLSPAGVRYTEYAHRVLGMLDEAASAVHAAADPGGGRLRVAAVTSAGEVLLPRLLAGFRSLHPRAGLDLEVGPRSRVWELLRRHAVDLAVAGRPPDEDGATTYATRPNVLVVVAASRPAQDPLRLEQVAWLLREPGSGTRETLEALLESLGGNGPRLTLGSNGAVIAGAVAGLGATLASRDAVAAELGSGSLAQVPVRGTPLDRPFHLVGHGALPPTARLFVDHVLSSDDWQAAPGDGGSPGAPPVRGGRGARRPARVGARKPPD